MNSLLTLTIKGFKNISCITLTSQTISLQHHALYTYTHSNNQLTASCFVHIHTLKQSAYIIMLCTHTHTQTISLQHHALYTYTHSNNQLTASCFVHIHTLKQSACIILVLGCTSLHKALTMCSMFWITRSASLSGVVFAVLMPLEPTNIRMRRHPLYVCTSRQTIASSVLYTPSYRLL